MLWQTLKSLLMPGRGEDQESLDSAVLRLILEKRTDAAKELLEAKIGRSEPEPELCALLGEVEYHLNNPVEAERLYLDALRRKPGLASAHYGLSLIYYDQERREEALAQAQYARNLQPSSARFLSQHGLCCIALNNHGLARDVLRQAVLLEPGNVPALNNLGIAYHALNEKDRALYHFQRALALDPDYAPARENLRVLFGVEFFSSHFDSEANALQSRIEGLDQAAPRYAPEEEARQTEELEEVYEQNPDDAEAAADLVQHYLRILQLDSARDVLSVALAHNPTAVQLKVLTGRITHMLGQLSRAEANYEQALAQEPDNVEALLGLGQVLRDLNRHDDALKPVERAATIEENANTLTQLTFTQVNACHYEEALKTCDHIETLHPWLAPYLLSSRAVSHAYLGQYEQAMRCLDEAQGLQATNPGFSVFRGMVQLQHENYAEGWVGYRYRALNDAQHTRLLPYPPWRGEPLEHKTILILAEQGLGDQIMFASCLPDLLALGPKKVLLEANARVEKTLARSFPAIQVFPSSQRGFEWLPQDSCPDYYLPIADLAGYFRQSKADFPEHDGYLVADPDVVAGWKARLAAVNAKPKIGISWRGGTQQTRRAVRSLQLEELEGLLVDPRFQFVNLQYGAVQEELANFARERGLTILDWPEAIRDLDEFAALVSALDLVVTVCNTTVHYSGALGKPCWVMTPFIPEWRYGIDAPRMRWYPATRMFRQKDPGDWPTVHAGVMSALDAWWVDQEKIRTGMEPA